MHPALAADGAARQVDSGEPLQERRGRFGRCLLGGWLAEEIPAPRDVGATRAVGEQPEMADPYEAFRHDVEQKAPQKFVGVQRHDFPAVVVGVILPVEPDAAVGVVDEPVIRQRDAVGVPAQVLEDLFGAGEGPLRIDAPVDGPQRTEKASEGLPIGQIRGAAREGQLAGVERALQPLKLFRTKDPREGADGKQERRSTGDPA